MGYVGGVLAALYPWTVALHLIAVISWMAGLFYLPRLFVYHVEKAASDPKLDLVYQEMEAKLFRVIMTPAMVAAWAFGIALVLTPGVVDWGEAWPWIKALCVIAMTAFHELLGRWRKAFATGGNVRSGRFFRLANEAPTVLMVVIVLMVIGKPF